MDTGLIFISNELFSQFILPFLFVFAIIFAILEKTEVLGSGKHQINAIISLVSGLIFLSFNYAKSIVINLIPFMTVVLVILFVFILLYSFTNFNNESRGILGEKMRKWVTGAVIISVIVAILVFTGYWNNITEFTNQNKNAGVVWINIIFIVLIIAGISTVVNNRDSSKPKG